MVTGAEYLLNLWKKPTARDKQVKIGASQFGSPCTYCVGEALLREVADNSPRPYWLGASIGTAIHERIEKIATADNPRLMLETRVTIGTLPDYGEITSSLDFYDPEKYWLIDWKGLALDTVLPTPEGWTTMAEVQEGDYLLGPDGKPTKVVAKSEEHNNPCYEISFDDGTTVVADHEHLWEVNVGQTDRSKTMLMTTEQIVQRGLRGKNGQRDVRIMNTAPIQCVDSDLPIDPYVLGIWLGDGASSDSRVCNANNEQDIWNEIAARGYEFSHDYTPTKSVQTRTIYGIRGALSELGLLGNKHLPAKYLRASEQQRRDLLAGLLDADGYYNDLRKRVDMQTTQYWQAEAIYDLAVSLGWTATINTINTKWQNGNKTAWMVSFSPDEEVFKHRNRGKKGSGFRSRRRLIKSIERVETVTTQCLQVDNAQRMYLCTRAMVPTHNTTSREKMKMYKFAQAVEPDPTEVSKVSEARFVLQKYLGQLMSYGLGLENAGMKVERASIVFIAREGKTDDDIWSIDMDYDRDYALKVWDRLARLWDYLRNGGDLESLPQHIHCYTCSTR